MSVTHDGSVMSPRVALTMGLVVTLAASAAPAIAAESTGAETTQAGVQAPASGGAGVATATTAAAPAVAKPRRPRLRVTGQRGDVRVGGRARYRGRVTAVPRSTLVRLEVRRGGRWREADRARTSPAGRFRLATTVRRTGDLATRIRVAGTTHGRALSRRVERVHGFRATHASYYGPGLYGGALACGGRLSPGTIGVAHKTLPCGTRLTFKHGGRTVQARVIDRGPYVAGREFDLTAATKGRLGFGSTGTVLVDR